MDILLRPAKPDDATHLAELINYAGEGMPLYLWERMAKPGESAYDVGRRRARREVGGFSYVHGWMAEIDRKVSACLIGYKLTEEPEEIDYATVPAMFVPLQELENLAPGTWYVNVLATYPEHRGNGVGTYLLRHAEGLAQSSNAYGLSIIVADANTDARRLYERVGYTEVARRPMVKANWRNHGKNWILLTK